MSLMYFIRITEGFQGWMKSQPEWFRKQIDERLYRIKIHGHFGNNKFLGHGLWELKFTDKAGTRIYYTTTHDREVFIILGGVKNGQQKDIKKARAFILT